MMNYSNVIIIGSGIAALQLARKLRNDLNVMIITKSTVVKSNSYLAQGDCCGDWNE
ncbi:FAD-binding protein [Bacillus sp. N9]